MNRWIKQTSSKAFTIIELLIVIVVIGILIAIVFVGYAAVQSNAQDNAAKSELNKVGDSLNVKFLDTKGVLAGGATSGGAGDSTTFPGVSVSVNKTVFDTSTINLFYCSGAIDGTTEFALIGRAKSGKIFSFKSNGGLTELSGSTAMTYTALCTAAGFSAPYTWAYGYNPDPVYGWFAWANGEAEMVTNLAVNPSAESATGWYSNNGAVYPVTFATTTKRTGDRAIQSSNVGTSTTLMSLYAPGAPDSNGIAVTSGGDYTIAVYVRAEVEARARLGMASRSSGVWTGTVYGPYTSVPANQWVRISYTTNVPSTADTIRHTVGVEALVAQTAGIKAYADDVMITTGTNQWMYRDGSFNGWIWTGTANASTSQGLGQAFN